MHEYIYVYIYIPETGLQSHKNLKTDNPVIQLRLETIISLSTPKMSIYSY